MEFFLILIIAAPLLGLLIKGLATTPSQSLNQKFVSLGDMTGKNANEIIAIVGEPNSVSSTIDAEGKTVWVYQWIQVAYHIVLLFDENKRFICISSETKIDETAI